MFRSHYSRRQLAPDAYARLPCPVHRPHLRADRGRRHAISVRGDAWPTAADLHRPVGSVFNGRLRRSPHRPAGRVGRQGISAPTKTLRVGGSRLKKGSTILALVIGPIGAWGGMRTVAYCDGVGISTVCFG